MPERAGRLRGGGAGPAARAAAPPPSCGLVSPLVAAPARSDAEDACRARDGYDFYGNRLRVEIARGGTRERGGPVPLPPGGWRNRGTGWRVVVRNLPQSASWQDLKVSGWVGRWVGWWGGGLWCRAARLPTAAGRGRQLLLAVRGAPAARLSLPTAQHPPPHNAATRFCCRPASRATHPRHTFK